MANLHIRGVPLPDSAERDVYVTNGRFTFAPVEDAVTAEVDCFLLPGLVDAHAHLALASPAPPTATDEEAVRASARLHRDAGVLLVREPGSINYASRELGPQEDLPRVATAGRFLAPPGGYFKGLARPVTADALPDAAEAEARASGAWVKVIGDFVTATGAFRLNYDVETLREAAGRAHAAGARITMHVGWFTEAIEAAIEAGFDAIEHGAVLQAEHLSEMGKRDIAWVPTMTIFEDPDVTCGMMAALGVGKQDIADSREAFLRQGSLLRPAVDAGVRVFAGTDAGMGPHGLVRHELELLAACDLTPTEVLGAGSWDARAWIGLGSIEEGAPADLVAYRRDPRDDLRVLGEPVMIVLDGRVVMSADG